MGNIVNFKQVINIYRFISILINLSDITQITGMLITMR